MDSVLKHIDNAIEVKDFVKAAALVNDLRKEHESDIRVILKWTNLALFLKQFDKAFLYVESQYNKDRSMLEKALLADCASVAQYFMMNLDIALLWSHRTILHLTQLAERNEIPKPPEQGVKKFMGFEEGIVDSIIWPVLVKLHQQNIPATLFEGSLLAITREGKFFSYDKDVDLMVWQESFNELCVWLQNNGWKRASNLLPFDNFAAFVHNEMDLTLDVMGLKRMPENHNILGGFWLYSHSRDFQLLTSYPYFKLETKNTPFGDVFWPTNAEAILCANYGNNWQEPDPKWVSFISEPSIRYDTALATYYAYQQIRSYWFKSDMMATHKSLVKALERCPNNTLLLNALSAVKPIYNELLNKGTL